jgi:hypothetical protein
MEIEWALAHPLHDVDDIVEMADTIFGDEVVNVLTTSRAVFTKNVTIATTIQCFDRTKEFIAVARNQNKLLGFCWFDRYGYTTYSNEEISNAKFHHVDLNLPTKTRVRLLNAMIDQHILWAHQNGIPVICSTSIRSDHDGFMKIHAKRGFEVKGSYAWIKTKDGLNGIKGIEIRND